MYHDHDAFDRVSRAMRKPHAPGPVADPLIIPELIERLADLFATRAPEAPDCLRATPAGGMQPPCSSIS